MKYYFKWALFVIGLFVTVIATPILITFILKGFLCWKEPLTGSITAFVVVSYCYLLAPKYNVIWSVVGFLLGAALANAVPGIHWYPECHELAYQKTYIPLIFTYTTGLATLIFCIYASKKI